MCGLLVDGEAGDPLVEAFAPLPLQGAAAQEVDGALQFAGEGQSGFQRIVVQPQVHVPVAVAFLDAQRVDGPVSGVGHAPLLSGFHQRPVDGHRVLLSAVQLPTCASDQMNNGAESCGCGGCTQFSDERDAQGAHHAAADVDQPVGGEREVFVAERRPGTQFLQNGAAATELRISGRLDSPAGHSPARALQRQQRRLAGAVRQLNVEAPVLDHLAQVRPRLTGRATTGRDVEASALEANGPSAARSLADE